MSRSVGPSDEYGRSFLLVLDKSERRMKVGGDLVTAFGRNGVWVGTPGVDYDTLQAALFEQRVWNSRFKIQKEDQSEGRDEEAGSQG